MKPRLTVVFVLIVLLPLVILGLLGVRVARNERVVLEQRFNALALDRLRDVDARIASFLAQREREWLALPALSSQSFEQLRAMVRESATIRQYFVLNDRNELRYPISRDLVREYVASKAAVKVQDAELVLGDPRGEGGGDPRQEPLPIDTLTADETAFLERTHEIWANKRIPAADPEEAVPAQQKGGKGAELVLGDPRKEQGAVGASVPAKGWYGWYWGAGLNLIFWWRDDGGSVVGAELNPARFAADIVGMLPDTHPENTSLPGGRIALRDAKGGTIYQWGLYEPAEDARAIASLPLRAPLSSWRLDYYSAPDLTGAALGRGVVFNLVSGLAVLGLAVLVLAVYYYRESSREIREATQRVSFVNQVSHELKTPLTSIRMYAEMLEEDLGETDEKARRHIGVIVAESQRLSRLIGNVLTFGRKQRSALKLHSAPGVIDNVIRDVLDHFGPTLDAKGLEVVFDDGGGGEVRFDRDALEQILGNLLGNVEKYAVSGDRVEIASRREEDTVVITVADNGPGIPARDRERIFEPFYRVSDKLTDGVAGAGIGLAIARDLARLHGGDLTLEPGEKGACFKVVIRVAELALGDPRMEKE